MRVANTNELSKFMDDLKAWAKAQSYENIVASIESAELTSFTASELIIKYSETLKRLKTKLPMDLPPEFKNSWDQAILIGEQGVQTVHYEEKKRSIFSLG